MNPTLKRICQLLKAPDKEIQQAAVRVLMELEIRDRQAIRLIGEALTKTGDGQTKELMLGIPIRTPAKEYLPYLIPGLNDAALNREKTVRAVSSLGASALSALERRYPKALGHEKRMILTVFSKIKHRRSLELLLKSLLDSHDVEHLKLVCSLLRDPINEFQKADRRWFRTVLLKFLNQPRVKKSPPVTTSCLILLGYLKDAATKRALLKYAVQPSDLMTKKYALIALFQLGLSGRGHEDVVRGLIPMLNDPDYLNVVKPAIDVLNQLEIPKRLQPSISKLLECVHSSVRSFALSKLGTFESKENVSTLIGYLGSPDIRIREAAKNSLERMRHAAIPLIKQFESISEPEKMDLIASILKHHGQAFGPGLCKKLFKKLEKLYLQNDERYRQYLLLLRNVKPDYVYKAVLAAYKPLKRKRKWDLAVQYLSLLEGSTLFTNDVRFELAICKIMTVKKDYAHVHRDQDRGLLLLQGLIKSNGPALYKKILGDPALKPDDKYYVGFHFAEKLFDLKEFGVKILASLKRGKARGGVAKLARRKLDLVGTGSAIL